VYDDHLVAFLSESQDPAGGVSGHRAADLDDEPRHDRYSALIRT
jgi:hypothetical protein